MKKMSPILLVTVTLAAVLTLSACSDVRKAMTQTKATPDEFAVYTRAPLTMPPDYGLRPPSENDQQTASVQDRPQDTAKRVLLNNATAKTVPIQGATPGTTALLARAGAHTAEANIRQVVNSETTAYADEDKSVMENIMFWQTTQAGTTVDPGQETKRIQENQALGQPVNEGNTPMIETKPKAPLEGVFDGLFN